MRHWKGQHVVVEALSHLDSGVLDRMQLLFVGAVREEDEAYAADLKNRVAEIGAEASVQWVGNRDDEYRF